MPSKKNMKTLFNKFKDTGNVHSKIRKTEFGRNKRNFFFREHLTSALKPAVQEIDCSGMKIHKIKRKK